MKINKDFITGFQRLTKPLLYYPKGLGVYYTSYLAMMEKKVYWKIHNGYVFFIRPTAIMGTYSLVLYQDPFHYKTGEVIDVELIADDLRKNGVTIVTTKKVGGFSHDTSEIIYSKVDYLKREGSKYRKIRNALKGKTYTIEQTNILDRDTIELVLKWQKEKRAKQVNLVRPGLFKINKLYYQDALLGVSALEQVSESMTVIVLALLDYDVASRFNLKEPNFLLHDMNCNVSNTPYLNIGMARNNNIRLAKMKLRPCRDISIYRGVAVNRLSKEEWHQFKNNNKKENGLF